MKKQSLPKGFRYLFSKKEVRSLEENLDVAFKIISFGKVTFAENFENDNYFQSSIWPLEISAKRYMGHWEFQVHQTGFRTELLPTNNEIEAKEGAQSIVAAFIAKIQRSTEADFFKCPKLFVWVSIRSGELVISSREEK